MLKLRMNSDPNNVAGAGVTIPSGQETPGDTVDIQQLISSINKPGAEAAPGADTGGNGVVKFGGIDEAAFNKALVEATGGQVADFGALKQALALRSKYSELETSYNSLKAKAEVSPYANEMVEQINSLYKQGASEAEVRHFLALQSMDFSAMSDRDVILEQRLRKSPKGVTKEDLMAVLEDDYRGMLPDPDDEDSKGNPSLAAKFKIEAAMARQELEGLKVKSAVPESVQQVRAQQQRMQELSGKWHQVLNALINSRKEIPFAFKDEKARLDYSYNFPVPTDQNQAIIEQAVNYMIQNQVPLTEQGLDTAMQFVERARFMAFGPQMIEAAVRHAVAQAAQTNAQAYAGLNNFAMPTATVSGINPNVAENPGGGVTLDQIRKAGLG